MIASWNQHTPQFDHPAFLAPSADILGQVTIGHDSSIWYQSVLRGDVEAIIIGARSNIQDHCTLHTSEGITPCVVGDEVTIGHQVVLHGCTIGDRSLIGMGAVVMDRAIIEPECMVAASALVTEGKVLKTGFLYAGAPARERRPLTEEERVFLTRSAKHYVAMAHLHQHSLKQLPI